MTLFSDQTFRILLSAITGVVAAGWTVHDIVLMVRLRGADRRDPLVADKWFGYTMGIVIGIIGVVGTLRFNGVL
ncbi:MAG TPA: hypothetical protein VHN14_13975 [Kofleriaceae bacterium]|jgi:hypothetical protein|nr:hypothetical protein [Kofleriaceae bacterium]